MGDIDLYSLYTPAPPSAPRSATSSKSPQLQTAPPSAHPRSLAPPRLRLLLSPSPPRLSSRRSSRGTAMKGAKSRGAAKADAKLEVKKNHRHEQCTARTMLGTNNHTDMSGPRWKKGKDGKDFAALAAANPMSSIVAELQASLGCSKLVATLSGRGGDAILGVKLEQAVLLNRAAFGRAVENAGAEKQWFQLSPEEVFYLSHALKCFTVESENKKQMTGRELWDHLSSTSESFPKMYKAYSHLRSKNWVVRSGLQYGADFVAYRHHPALVHSEFAVVVVPEGKEFGHRCGRLKVWSDLLCALRASGSVAKKLLVLTINNSSCELSSPDCLEQLIVHERTITRWIPQQCREQRHEPCREEANMEEQDHKRESVVFNYWGVILGFTVFSSLLVYRLKF